MIPYDDLVAALQAWRARQGLPVSSQAPVAAQGSNGQPVPRTAPPAPPPPPPAPAARTTAPQPAARTTAPQPAPLAPVDTTDENLDHIDPSLIEEAHYENEGDDFAMSFGNDGSPASGEETLAGEDIPHNTREDW